MIWSDLYGDIELTQCEQPANQLRVLNNLLSETKRWLSSVFYGTIGHVLPYINGFVMALKQLVKTFALFMGYKVPDSTGQTSTILDSMTEGAEDFGGAIGDANTGLDQTKKKLKEIEGSLASFDKLNVINKPNEDSESGGGGGSAGGGGLTVDPRLLDALNKYNDLFGDVQMKATKIAEQILKWYDNIQKAINDNVFAPLGHSWDKYGTSISKNFDDTFKNLSKLSSDFFDTFFTECKNGSQVSADFWVSMLDTSSLVLSKVTGFLLDVWNIGGKYLLEKLFKFTRSLAEMGTSINDHFIKPFVKGFSSTFGKLLSTILGNAMKLLGGFIEVLSDVIKWLSKSKTVVVILGSALTAMFATIKVAKIADMAKKLGGAHSALRAFGKLALQHSKTLRTLWKAFKKVTGNVSKTKGSLQVLNEILGNTKFFKKYGDALRNVAGKCKEMGTKINELGSDSSGLATKLMNGLSKALTWIAANPVVALIGGITALTAGLALFATSQDKATYKMEDYSKAVQQNLKDVQDLSQGMKDAKKNAEDSYSDSLAQIDVVSSYVDKLKKLGGKSGYVNDIGLAQFYIDKINEKMPDTVKLTENYRLEWQKTPQEIDQVIKKMKERAYYEAYEQLYVESVKSSIKATQKSSQAQDELNEKKALLNKLEKENVKENYSAKKQKQINKLKADIDGLGKTVKTSDKTVKDAKKSMKYYEDQMSSTGNTAEDATNKMAKSYDGLSDTQNNAFAKLGTQLALNKLALKDHADGVKKMNDDEVENTQSAANSVIKEYAKKASEYGLSYDDMLSVLSQQGIKLNKDEQKLLKDSLDNENINLKKKKDSYKANQKDILKTLKEANVLMSEEDEKQYKKMLDTLNDHGIHVTAKKAVQYNTWLNMMKDSGLKIGDEQGQQYVTLLGMLDKQGIKVEETKAGQYKTYLKLLKDANLNINNEQGQQYALLLGTLDEQGIKVSEKKSKQYQNYLALLQKANLDINDEQGKQYATLLGSLDEQGVNVNAKNAEQFQSLFTGLQNYGVQVDGEHAKQYKQILDMVNQKGYDLNTVEGRTYAGLLGLLTQNGININTESSKQMQSILRMADDSGFKLTSKKGQLYVQLLGMMVANGVNVDKENSKQMKSALKMVTDNGIDIKTEKGKQYVELMAYLIKHNINVNSEDGKNYAKGLAEAQKHGEKQGEEYIKKMGKGQEKQKNPLKKKTKDVISSATNEVDKTKPEVKIKVSADRQSISDARQTMINSLNSIRVKIKGKGSNMWLNAFANGGYPQMGQLFVARERGPELVGLAGSKTTVINNDQIIQGVGTGVYNAIFPLFQALASVLGSNQNINLQVSINDDYVEKKVKKANEKSLLKTGKPLFNK